MSEKYKLKYEVVNILRDNLLKGMEAFGLQLSERAGDGGWTCMEADQPAFRNGDKFVLFWMEKTERIGIQSHRTIYNKEIDQFEDIDYFIEQQIWKIKVICKRSTEPVTEDAMPLTTEDVASMLIAWFNRLGCEEFRKHNMANLFVQMKDVKTYKSTSDVSQWTTEFPLKVQVIKEFDMEVPWATPEYMGAIGVPLPEENKDEGDSSSDSDGGDGEGVTDGESGG